MVPGLPGDEPARLRLVRRLESPIFEFLRFFPSLRLFSADALHDSLTSLDGLRHLSTEAEYLGIGETKARLDLRVLARFGALTRLHLERQTKGLEVISGLTSLRDLTLRSITMPDLSLLVPLTRLRSFALKLGGTRDLELLPGSASSGTWSCG